MTLNQIKCEVSKVNTETGICPGIAETKFGEQFIIGACTPDSTGICCQAFGAMNSMRHVLMVTEKMDWEKNDHMDIVCPHGFVTYRLSRIKKSN